VTKLAYGLSPPWQITNLEEKREKTFVKKIPNYLRMFPTLRFYLAYHDVHLGSLQWKRPMGERHLVMQGQIKVSLPQEQLSITNFFPNYIHNCFTIR